MVPTESIRERWQFSTQGESFSAATIVDGTVYVGSSSNFVYALNAETGERRWQFLTDNSIRSAPAVDDGTVYVSSTDANLYALSADDGSEQWAAHLGLPVYSSPTPVGDTIYVGGRNGEVYALGAASGEEQWAFKTDDPIYGSLAVSDGIVYAANESGVAFALDAEDGNQYWQTQIEGGIRSPPVVTDETLYLTNENDQLVALTTQFGEQLWSKNIPIPGSATLAATESTLAVPGANGTLYVLDPETGTERYQFDAGGRCYSPIVADGILCMGISDGIRAIDPATSAQHWTYTLGSSAHPSLSVSNGVVYAGGENGTLYAIVGDETRAPESGSTGTETRTLTKTATETTTPSGSQSENESTGSEAPAPTPTITTMTDTATPVVTTAPSQPSDIRENRMILAGIGSVVVGAVLLAGYLGLQDTSTAGDGDIDTESRDNDVSSGGAGTDTADVTDDTDSDERIEKATQALEKGQRAKDQGEYGRATTHLEEAIRTFDQALSAVNDDRAGEIRDDLETAKAALLSIDSVRQTLDDVEELLSAAEADMENAIVAFVNGQQTVARVRFRQARDRYERAIEQLDNEEIEQLGLSVDISTDEALDEIDTFEQVLGVDADTIDVLRDAGYEMPTDLHGQSVEELATAADVDDETAARLRVASWHTPTDQRRFESVDDVEARLESAVRGYQSC
jgi:outer membrane protein assembly factor BamB/predicted negative regulator of RcsB-dependent stress response